MSATPWTAECQASLSITISQGLFKLMSIKSVMPPNHFILCHPFLLLPSIFPIRVFSNVSALRIRWPKFWSCSFSINLYNEYSELIFFRTDWLDLLAVKGTLRSLLQNHSLKASILWHSAFLSSNSHIHKWLLEKHIFDYKDLYRQSNVSAVSISWSEPQSAAGLVSADCTELLHLPLKKNISNLILVLTIWWCPCVESSFVLLEEGLHCDLCVLLAKLC